MSQKPNIIFTEDHQAYYHWEWETVRYRCVSESHEAGCRGRLFHLISTGTLLCGPGSRRTMLTGLFAHTHKQYH